MKRVWLLLAGLCVTAACSDSDTTTGPEGPSGNVTNISVGGGLTAFASDICGTVGSVPGFPGPQVASPCDANSNFPPPSPAPDPGKLPYTGSTYWLSSLEASPNPIPPNFSGLASRLKVRAYPYPNRDHCANLSGGSAGVCEVRDGLPAVTEVVSSGTSVRYETSWKSKKSKAGGPGSGDFVPNNSYWQIVLFLDFDGSGTWELDEDLASRIIKWTDTPSSDQPLDGWSLDVNWGSNQPIPFVLEANQEGCFGLAQAENNVACLVDFGSGGTLILETENGAVILELGAGNDLSNPLRTVTGSVGCEEGTSATELDVDAATAGTCTHWEISPPLGAGDPLLVDSFLWVCEALLGTLDLESYVIHMQSPEGIEAQVPTSQASASSACSNYGFVASTGDDGTGLRYVLNRVKRLLAPKMLWALNGSSGSSIETIRSDFQLVQTAQMRAAGGVSSFTVAENSTTTLQAIVKDHADELDGLPTSNAVVSVFSDANTSVACPAAGTDPDATCENLTTLPAWASDGVRVTTGSLGIVEVDATVGTLPGEVRMLGCGIGVPGLDTPVGAGSPGPCDRDPADVDGVDGFANGVAVGIVDPFMQGGVVNPVWINDLPLKFSLDVCSAPSVDGVKGESEPWSSSCIPAGFSDSFEVNVGGNIGGGGTGPIIADLEWVVATEPAALGGRRRVYFGLEIPLASDPTSKKVSVAIEFDKGGASDALGVANEFDDQIQLVLDKFSANPLTGDVFDRHLKQSCTTSTSVCNSLDSDVGGNKDAEGAMAWNPTTNTLFIEMSQVLDTDDPVVAGTVDRRPDLHGFTGGGQLGFILQFGVGNVQQGGTVFPGQGSGPKTYRTFTIPN